MRLLYPVSLLLLFVLPAAAQRADSLAVSRWIIAPAPFYRQNNIVRIEQYETTKGRDYTGSYVKLDSAGQVIESFREVPLAGKGVAKKRTFRYDNTGAVIEETNWTDRLSPQQTLHREYDVHNHPLAEYVIEYGDTNYTRHWQYDKRTRMAVEYGTTVPLARDVFVAAGWTEYFYDTLGRLSKSVSHSSYRAPEYTYATDSVLDIRRHSPIKYDSSDVPFAIEYKYSPGKMERYSSSPVTGTRQPIVYTFDEAGRITAIDEPSTMYDRASHRYEFTYGDNGLLTRCVQTDSLGGQKSTRTFEYEYLKKGEKHKKKTRSDAAVPEQY